MNKDKFLADIRKNQPRSLPLLDLNFNQFLTSDPPVETFVQTLARIGGEAVEVENISEAKLIIEQRFPEIKKCFCAIPEMDANTVNLAEVRTSNDLDDLQLVILPGQLGVAENGAVWIADASMGKRVAPFITEHLVIVLSRQNIVQNLHQAYTDIGTDEYNYGVFIAGPSKTADIEQSLVIGAHGPLSLMVFLIANGNF